MQNQFYFYRTNGILQQIRLEDIVFMAADSNYTNVFEHKRKHIVRATLDTVLKRLPAHLFCRTHRSYAVALRFVNQIGREELQLSIREESIPVSKQYYSSMIKQLVIFEDSSKRVRKKDPIDHYDMWDMPEDVKEMLRIRDAANE